MCFPGTARSKDAINAQAILAYQNVFELPVDIVRSSGACDNDTALPSERGQEASTEKSQFLSFFVMSAESKRLPRSLNKVNKIRSLCFTNASCVPVLCPKSSHIRPPIAKECGSIRGGDLVDCAYMSLRGSFAPSIWLPTSPSIVPPANTADFDRPLTIGLPPNAALCGMDRSRMRSDSLSPRAGPLNPNGWSFWGGHVLWVHGPASEAARCPTFAQLKETTRGSKSTISGV
jgi:hypothetical protein